MMESASGSAQIATSTTTWAAGASDLKNTAGSGYVGALLGIQKTTKNTTLETKCLRQWSFSNCFEHESGL